MYNFKRAAAAALVAFAMCTSAAQPAFCAEATTANATSTEELTSQDIVSGSVIYYTNMNRLLNLGELSFVDPDTTNIYKYINGGLYADISWLCNTFDLDYSWDGTTSSIIFHGASECLVKCSNLTADSTSDTDGYFVGTGTYIPVKTLCDAMGWGFYSDKEIWAISKTIPLAAAINKNNISQIVDSGKTVEAEYDFESELTGTMYCLLTGCEKDSFVKQCQIVDDNDNKVLQIGATTSGNGGLYMPGNYFEDGKILEYSFDVKTTGDFAGNSFRPYWHSFKDNTFVNYIDGIYNCVPKADGWTHVYKKIDTSTITGNVNNLRLAITSKVDETSGDPAGAYLIDNLKIISYIPAKDNSVTPDIKGDKVGNWYILGETITMTPKEKIDEKKYKNVIVDIYDSWGNIVKHDTISVEQFNNGHKWTPKEQGYYSYKFHTINHDGIKEELNEFIMKKNPKTNEEVKIEIKDRGVVVAKEPTKPMEERCDRLTLSIDPGTYLNPDIAVRYGKNGMRGDSIEIADLIGFRRIRFHFISPDGLNYKTPSQANVKRGSFDFAEWDGSVNDAKALGFDLLLNIMGTPRYSAPYREGWTSPSGAGINYYTPVDMEAWRAYVEYAVKRYKDVCNKWEIWNEPHVYGGSVFWKGITPDFAEMLKTGYNVVKKYQPGDQSMVAIGGIGARRYTNFYEELMQTDAYDYYDVLPMHGWDVDPWTYNNIAAQYGKEPKPIISTEMHMMLRASDSEYLNNTEKEEALRMVVEFLKDFKYGAILTTFFQISMSDIKEWLQYLNENKIYGQGIEGGAYKKGAPRFAAMAMHTFFETMGKQYDYKDEYLLANKKQNVVRVNSDGKDQLIVWNVGGSKSKTTILSKEITDSAAEDFKIIDWEGHDVDTSDMSNIQIMPETVYFISGLNSSRLDQIPSAQGEEIYTGDVLFNITEKEKNNVNNLLVSPVELTTIKPLFDKDSFVLADDIKYIDTNWRWRPKTAGAQQGDFGVKYAFSLADDGMYIVADVNDSTDDAVSSGIANMNLKDSLQFAFDTVGDKSDNGYMECYVGLDSSGTPKVYKKTAPYIGGDLISDFTPGDSEIKKAKVSRERNGNNTLYKIYLPNSEIYPLEQNINDPVNFSILANQSDGDGVKGYLEWSGGLGDVKSPRKFGKLWIDEKAAKDNGAYYPKMFAANNTPIFDRDTFEYADDIIWNTDGFEYISLTDEETNSNNPDNEAKFALGVTEEGIYVAAEVADSCITMNAKGPGGIWSMDCMQFGVDLGLKGVAEERVEFEFANVLEQGTTLYKEFAPFIAVDKAPAGYTQKTTKVENCSKKITTDNGKIVYKVFIPADEFYPFNIAENDVLKCSILFGQHDGTQRTGYMEWNAGIGGSKNPKEYGIVSYK